MKVFIITGRESEKERIILGTYANKECVANEAARFLKLGYYDLNLEEFPVLFK